MEWDAARYTLETVVQFKFNVSQGIAGKLLVCIGASALAAYASFDPSAWKAYEAIEEAWIRECHSFVIQQAPAGLGAAQIDLEIKLAELRHRGMAVQHISKCAPKSLSGGVWQLTALTVPDGEDDHLAAVAEYRKLGERIAHLRASLKAHPQYSLLRRAQTRLWKTPQYRNAHRRYTGRLQELQTLYGDTPTPSASTID
jgi:hypothetical protein